MDKTRFQVVACFYFRLAINDQEITPDFKTSDFIPLENFKGFKWVNVSVAPFFQKRKPENGSVEWSGN